MVSYFVIVYQHHKIDNYLLRFGLLNGQRLPLRWKALILSIGYFMLISQGILYNFNQL